MTASLRFIGVGYNSVSNPYKHLFSRRFSSKLFLKGISFFTTEETLAKEFSQFGEVIGANIVMDKTRNRSKGFGFVTFAKEDDADKALIDMNGKLLDGRVVFVDKAWPSRHFKDHRPIARGPPGPGDDVVLMFSTSDGT